MRENMNKTQQDTGFTREEVIELLEEAQIDWRIIQELNLIVCEDGSVYKSYKNGWRKYGKGQKGPYITISVKTDNGTKHFSVHRLIAAAFIPNPYGYEQINHIDGNGQNNAISNLEWCDAAYNIRDAKKRHAPKYLTNLRVLRNKYGLKAHVISIELGILRGTYRDIENAVEKPIPYIAKKLEELFGESIDYLLSEAKEND